MANQQRLQVSQNIRAGIWKVEPHWWGERVQSHQPRAAATWAPPYLLSRGESAVPHGHPQRANVGQNTPCVSEEEKLSVYGCSNILPLVRRSTAICAKYLAASSDNVSPWRAKLSSRKACIAAWSAIRISRTSGGSGNARLCVASRSVPSSAATNVSHGETAQHRERGVREREARARQSPPSLRFE